MDPKYLEILQKGSKLLILQTPKLRIKLSNPGLLTVSLENPNFGTG